MIGGIRELLCFNQAVLISTHGTCYETGAVLKTIKILKYLHDKICIARSNADVVGYSLKGDKYKENCTDG